MLWLAHALTLSRIPAAIALGWALERPVLALALVAWSALSDTLDGTVARAAIRRGARGPDIGGWLDPLIDKVFVAIAVVVIWLHTRATLPLLLIGARELLFAPLAALYLLRHQRPAAHAHPIGKAATVAQFVALAVLVAAPRFALPVAAVAGLLGVATVLHYASARAAREDETRGADHLR